MKVGGRRGGTGWGGAGIGGGGWRRAAGEKMGRVGADIWAGLLI